MSKMIRSKERDAILQSLRAGVTPRTGIQHIQVGRVREIEALVKDINRICEGGSAFRIVVGEYGSGKTFFLSVIRSIALEKKLVTVNADLAPDRRIFATQGQARNLYTELMKNLSTRAKPDGGGMVNLVEKFITESIREAESKGDEVKNIIHVKLKELNELVGGYDFSAVVGKYWEGYDTNNEALRSSALRWLRAEYSTMSEARNDLGVRSIISDKSFYDSLKLMSLFVRQAGYAGLLVNLDELVNLFKLRSGQARGSNYEQILRILNDCLQGTASSIGFILGGTPEFLYDTRKGLYSYEALQTRLAENSFAKRAGVIDYNSPTLQLANLTPEELHVLLMNLRHVYAAGDKEHYLVPDHALLAFLNHCNQVIGEAYFRTPRNTIKAFIDLLSVLEQSPDLSWESLIQNVKVEEELETDMPEYDDDEGSQIVGAENLTRFKL